MSKITLKNKFTVPDGTDAITSASNINMQGNNLEGVSKAEIGEVQTSGLLLVDTSSEASVEVSSMDGKSVHFLGQIPDDTGAMKAGLPTLSDVADPVNPQDAATKNYVDTELETKPSTAELNTAIQSVNPAGKYLALSGGTMSGRINMNNNHIMGSYYLGLKNLNFILGNASDDALMYQPDETTVNFINKNGLMKMAIGDPTELDHAATKKYVDDAVAAGGGGGGSDEYLPLSGGDMSGDINMDVHSILDARTVRIIRDDAIEVDYPSDTITFQLGETPDNLTVYGGNGSLATVTVATPQEDKHAATKEYVDVIASTAGDNKYLGLSGGTMTGGINMNANPLTSVSSIIFREQVAYPTTSGISKGAEEIRIGMVNANDGVPCRVGAPRVSQHAATKGYVDGSYFGPDNLTFYTTYTLVDASRAQNSAAWVCYLCVSESTLGDSTYEGKFITYFSGVVAFNTNATKPYAVCDSNGTVIASITVVKGDDGSVRFNYAKVGSTVKNLTARVFPLFTP